MTRPYDPAKHGYARVWSGANAEARVAGVVDGHDSNPPRARSSFPTAEAAEVYRTAYLEHWNGTTVGLFPRPKLQLDARLPAREDADQVVADHPGPPMPQCAAADAPAGHQYGPQAALFETPEVDR